MGSFNTSEDESMRQSIWSTLAACVLLVLAISSAHAWQAGQPFSADTTSTSVRTGEKTMSKIYFSPRKMRMDSTARGHETIMIVDSSTKTSYMLMPQRHMYMEMRADQGGVVTRPEQTAPSSFDPKRPCMADATCKQVGTETISGRVCEKWETTTKRGTTTTWVDKKLFYPMKTMTATGDVMELSNVKEGKPDASLFEVPAGYRKMDMGSMMGGRTPH
jgi:outer membrane lipoprotein-sorting protein